MTRRVALITGATGFLGAGVARALLARGFHVLVLIRPKSNVRGGPERSAEARGRRLAEAWGLPSDAPLHTLSGDISRLDPSSLVAEVRSHLKALSTSRLQALVHCAARLTMDHPGQDEATRARIAERNREVNVGGLQRLLEAAQQIWSPASSPRVRILRPSIIAGPGSKDAYMAFLDYLEGRVLGLPLMSVVRFAVNALPPGAMIPIPGNPDGALDIIHQDEVVETMVTLLEEDLRAAEASGAGVFHHVSTAFVHGRSEGLLAEDPLPEAADLRPRNSYEATKGEAERILHAWSARPGRGAEPRICQISHSRPPTLAEVVSSTLEAFGWTDAQIERVRCVPPGPAFEAEMARLRSASPLAHRVAAGLWARVPMLQAYLDRPTGTSFSIAHTQEDLRRASVSYAPASFDADMVRALLRSAPLA